MTNSHDDKSKTIDGEVEVSQSVYTKLKGEMYQFIATNFNAMVTQKAKDRTITNTVTVAPSGDMARKAYYDRNLLVVANNYEGSLAAHTDTVRWTYTVPDGKKAIHGIFAGEVSTKIDTDTKFAQSWAGVTPFGGAFAKVFIVMLSVLDLFSISKVVTATFALTEGDVVQGKTKNTDTVAHWLQVASIVSEFDA